jgi:hypothetical protein
MVFAIIVISKNIFCQTLKVLDSISKINISDVLISNDIETKVTDNFGVLDLKNFKTSNFLRIHKLGYNDIKINYPKRDTIIYLSFKTVILSEIIVPNNDGESIILGNYPKKTLGVWVNSHIQSDNKFTIVNKYNLENGTIVKSFYFFVTNDESYKNKQAIGPLEIVFLRPDKNGNPSLNTEFSFRIDSYNVGWNKIDLDKTSLYNYNGIIYYGIRWIYDPINFHYKNITRKKTYNFFGPKLGTTLFDKNLPNQHQTYFYVSKVGWKKSNLSLAMLAIETLNY